MHRLGSNGNGRGSTKDSASDMHEELNQRILDSLDASGRELTASELAEHVHAIPRQVVGRLQSLKRRDVVAFRRYDSAPSAPGRWAITERGRQAIRPDES